MSKTSTNQASEPQGLPPSLGAYLLENAKGFITKKNPTLQGSTTQTFVNLNLVELLQAVIDDELPASTLEVLDGASIQHIRVHVPTSDVLYHAVYTLSYKGFTEPTAGQSLTSYFEQTFSIHDPGSGEHKILEGILNLLRYYHLDGEGESTHRDIIYVQVTLGNYEEYPTGTVLRGVNLSTWYAGLIAVEDIEYDTYVSVGSGTSIVNISTGQPYKASEILLVSTLTHLPLGL